MSRFFQLNVKEVKKETDDSVAIAFDVHDSLQNLFSYKPGQYLTLKFNIKGEEVRRSYSLCSAPSVDRNPIIGIKRVKDGLVSNYINDTISVGDSIEVMPPEGNFYIETNDSVAKNYYLFAAGSGITPILSILKSILYNEKSSKVFMLYGNRRQDSIMFKDELEQLQNDFTDRFILKHYLSKPKSSLWSKKSKMNYEKGRIDRSAVKAFITQHTPDSKVGGYYICGPGTMITDTKEALLNSSINEDLIHFESFGDSKSEVDNTEGFDNAALTALLDDETIEINIPKGKTILRALIDQEYDPPYSCEGGVCSTCICMLKKGKVHMRNNTSLTDGEIEEGYILSCQSIPLTEEIEVEFEY